MVEVPLTEAEFMDAVTRVGHPFLGPPDLPDDVTMTIFAMVTEGPGMTAKRLTAKVAGRTKVARGSEAEEEWREQILEHRRSLEQKRLELFR